MSTLLSTDLNVTRSTTRRLAPPGGGSSISLSDQSPAKLADDVAFGATVHREARTAVRDHHPTGADSISFGASDDPSKTPKSGRKYKKEASSIDLSDGLNRAAAASVAAPDAIPKPAAAASVAAAASPVPKYLKEIKIGVATVTTEEMSAQLQVSFSSAASEIGAVTFSCAVSSIFQLPAATQQLAKECDLVIAIFSIESTFSTSMISALATIAASTGVPCLQGVYASGADPAGISSLWVQDVAALTSRSVATTGAAAAAAAAGTGASALSAGAAEEVVVVQESTELKLLKQLRASLKKHGAKGIIGLGRKFRIIDDDGSGKLDKSEFKKAVKEHVLDWTDEEFTLVFNYFDTHNDGGISYDEFLIGVRGELNERRTQLVLLAFECLDKSKNGVIDLDDIMDAYSADKHPDVISGRKTKNQILREFLDTFDSPDDKDGKVTPAEFCRYYGNVSASIDDDDYFELMIRNAWHISGGEGWCANSSCRRVLVTHADGSQSVQEVKNDLGITAEDKDAMKANLEAQGIDVANMSLTGSLDTTEPPAKSTGPPPRTPKGKTQASSVVLG